MPAQKTSPTRRKKRATADDTDSEPRKRRARYALRACCDCKRRKVRCDGHLPCEHCQSRSIQCIYDTDPKLLANCACDALNQRDDCVEHKNDSTEDTSEIGRLARVVENMQSQINVLIELNKGPSNGQGGHPSSTLDTKSSPSSSCSVRSCSESAYEQDSAKHSSPRYWGATSSDYTLNVVRFCIRPVESQLGYSCRHRKIACYSPDPTPDNYEGVEETSESRQRMSACFCSDCTRCLRKLGKARALQLIDVYQEVIGHLHPVVNIKQQKSELDTIYAYLESAQEAANTYPEIEQDSLDITKIVLSIALLAQTTGQSDIASALYNSVQNRIQDAMTSDTKNIQSVVLTLLAAICHFFHDDVQLAWRMGGISGRMAMELGLHHRDARQRAEDESSDHGMITNILWSIVILDRLWSCSIGLPQNFQDADFAKSLPEPVEAPYLKAMVPYASFTPRLWDHNSRLLTADALENEDLFDVTNIQIDQWKERYLTGLSFVHPKDRLANSRPQSLPTLLYLRANLLRGLVVTSYFLSCSRLIGKKQMAQSGAEVACDTITVLWDLHKTTNIYHKQHPFFQHFLASSVALLFLVIMHESDSEENSITSIGERFDLKALSTSISRASNLAEAYSDASSASERLWNRMKSMRERLSRLGIYYTGEYSKQDEIRLLKQLDNHIPKRKSPLQVYSAGLASRMTDIALFDNPTVRPCSLNILNSNGALDYLTSDPIFGLGEGISSTDCGTDAYLHDIPVFEPDMDNQTWKELGAIFSNGL
ncbi:Zn(2)-C6 fungal-type domain-containing protein [Trichoderma simmonsii]|uniref:Zn(2)-C6 fungal-type domain-containing protein n=1 Tax=Trichoderma simmonsii TaxID=1491479 RepID=A0A8G0L280_9HYPO|nr:Zn(2)-C6 fungal-type domain-containing protein [Trichoderma simmonsii]